MGKIIWKTCLIWLKNHTAVKVLVFPIIFETTARALRQGHFFDPHVIVFVKNDWITISVPIILSINQWSLSFKSVVWTMIYISKLSVFNFPTNFYSYIKSDVRLNKTLKLNFTLMFSDTAYLARPLALWLSIQFKPLSYCWKDYSNSLGSYLLLYPMAIFEIEYSFRYANLKIVPLIAPKHN